MPANTYSAADTTSTKTEQFIQKARLKHGDRYDYSKVEYTNQKTKVLIICKLQGHGEFWQKPSVHLTGCGCLACAEEVWGADHEKRRISQSDRKPEWFVDPTDPVIADYLGGGGSKVVAKRAATGGIQKPMKRVLKSKKAGPSYQYGPALRWLTSRAR